MEEFPELIYNSDDEARVTAKKKIELLIALGKILVLEDNFSPKDANLLKFVATLEELRASNPEALDKRLLEPSVQQGEKRHNRDAGNHRGTEGARTSRPTKHRKGKPAKT